MTAVALVHDYLNQLGGAERVVVSLTRRFPGAPVHTTLYRPGSTFPELRAVDVRTSFADRVPVDRHFRLLLPLLPLAVRSLGRLDAELVLSSSSGWAHAVRTSPSSFHAVYCHTPARWLYERGTHMAGAAVTALAPAMQALRRWDRAASRRPDHYIANSTLVRDRIREIYDRDADVVHPPVMVERLRPTPRGQRLLVVSRLLPYKRVDLAVAAARRLGVGLDVVGDGPERARLQALAGPGTTLHGQVGEARLTQLLEDCAMLVVCGLEDFGMAVLEANAAGKPVVAYGRGGALETVRDGVTGVLFHDHDVEAVADAVVTAGGLDASPAQLRQWADGYAEPAFHAALDRSLAVARGR